MFCLLSTIPGSLELTLDLFHVGFRLRWFLGCDYTAMAASQRSKESFSRSKVRTQSLSKKIIKRLLHGFRVMFQSITVSYCCGRTVPERRDFGL